LVAAVRSRIDVSLPALLGTTARSIAPGDGNL